MIEDDELLKKYNDTSNKVSDSIKKELDSDPIYNKKFLKTKINFTVMRLNFDKEMTKVRSNRLKLYLSSSNINWFFS